MTLPSNISKFIIQHEFEQESFFLTSNINLLLFLTHYKLIYRNKIKTKTFLRITSQLMVVKKNIIECLIL